MRSFILVVVLGSFSCSAFAVIVGTVDMQKIMFTVKEGQKVRAKLEGRFNEKKAALSKAEGKLKKFKQQFDKKAQVMSEVARLKEQGQAQKMILALETKRQKYQQEIRALETRLTQPIADRIKSAVVVIAKKAEVDLVFEVSSTPILYSKNKKDLTNEVIKFYDKKHPGK